MLKAHFREPFTSGGEGGIRTHGSLATSPLFESGALDRAMRPLHPGSNK
jgi:hypothetical protein